MSLSRTSYIMLRACSIRITPCKSLNCVDFESVWTVKVCGLDDRKLCYLCVGIVICHDIEYGCEAYLLGGCMSAPRGMLRGIFRPVVLRTLVSRFLTGEGGGGWGGGKHTFLH